MVHIGHQAVGHDSQRGSVGGMYGHQQDRLLEACKQAMAQGVLFRYANPKERRAVRRAPLRSMLVEPLPRAFAMAQAWRALSEAERLRIIFATVAQDHPTWAMCSISAAYVMGLTHTCWYHSQVHMAIPRRHRGAYAPQYIARHVIPESAEIMTVNGIRTVTPERVLWECAQELPFQESLPIWDKAFRCKLTTRERMEQYLEGRASHCGVRVCKLLLRYANPASESGGESAARAVMLQLGFVEPQLQVTFRNVVDGRRIRPDFLWELEFGRKVAGEFDGMCKYKDEAILEGRDAEAVIIAEKDRETALNALGIMVTRFGWDDVREPRLLERELAKMGVPRVTGAELAARKALALFHGKERDGVRLSLRGTEQS